MKDERLKVTLGHRNNLATWFNMAVIAALLVPALAARGQEPAQEPGNPGDAIRFDQKLGDRVPLDVQLRDATGRDVVLGDLLGQRPAILVLVYYRCPMLCTMVLTSVAESLRDVPYNVGEEFDVVVVSIDQRETHELAARKKQSIVKHYGRPDTAEGWHMLTSPRAAEVARLADSVGFGFAFDQRSDQFAHPAGIVLLTTDGVVSQYFLGLDFPPRSLRLGLVNASEGKIGSLVDQVLLRCFQFDPMTGQYTVGILNVLRAAGMLTLLTLVGLVCYLVRVERRRGRELTAAAAANGSSNGKGETC